MLVFPCRVLGARRTSTPGSQLLSRSGSNDVQRKAEVSRRPSSQVASKADFSMPFAKRDSTWSSAESWQCNRLARTIATT